MSLVSCVDEYIGDNSSKNIHIDWWVDHNCWKNNDIFCLLLQFFVESFSRNFACSCSHVLFIPLAGYNLSIINEWSHPFLSCICLFDTSILWHILCIIFILKLIYIIQKRDNFQCMVLFYFDLLLGHTMKKSIKIL